MRLAATFRHSMFVVACLAAAAVAPGARASDADQVRSDLAAVLEQTFNTPQEPVLAYESIDIEGETAPFNVAIRGVRLGSETEGFADVGTVTLTVSPAGEGLYDITDLKFPTSITHTAPADGSEDAGKVDATIEVAEQSFTGRWSMPMQSFLTFDGRIGGLRGLDGKGTEVLTVASLLLKGDTVETAPNRWDQDAGFTLSDMRITGPEDGVVVVIGELKAGTEARRIDMVSFQAMMDKIEAAGAAAQQGAPMPAEESAPVEQEAAPPSDGEEQAVTDPNVSADQSADSAAPDEMAPETDMTMPDTTMPPGVPSEEMTPEQAQALQEMMEALQGIPNSIGDAESNIAISGLSIREADGTEMFKLDSGALEFSVSDLDQEKSGMRFAYRHTGLDADWNVFNDSDEDEYEYEFEFDSEAAGALDSPDTTESSEPSDQTDQTDQAEPVAPAEPEVLDAKTEQLIDALAPREFALDIRLEDVPSKQLWNTFVSTFYSGAAESPAGMGTTGMEMEMMGAMLPMMLAQAGSKVRIVDTRLVSQTAALSLEGDIQADPASMMGASGTMTVEITGLDAAIALVKDYAGPEGAADTAPLEMLRAFGERKEAEGQTVDRYLITLEPNGSLLVNGKDMNFLLGMGGDSGGGEMPQQ